MLFISWVSVNPHSSGIFCVLSSAMFDSLWPRPEWGSLSLLQGIFPNRGTEPVSPATAAGFFTAERSGKPRCRCYVNMLGGMGVVWGTDRDFPRGECQWSVCVLVKWLSWPVYILWSPDGQRATACEKLWESFPMKGRKISLLVKLTRVIFFCLQPKL